MPQEQKKRLQLNFRIKLVLSMLILVAALVSSVLYVTHRRMQASYDEILQEIFLTQLQNYYARQEVRNQFVKTQSQRLSQSVRLFAALEEGEPELVYQTASDELRDFRSDFKFFRILGPDGTAVEDPAQVSGMSTEHFEAQFQSQMAVFAPAFRASTEPQLNGFVSYQDSSGRPWLFELVITKIFNFEEDRVMGALVLGFPADLNMTSGVRKLVSSAIVMDDILFTKTIPASFQSQLMQFYRNSSLTDLEKMPADITLEGQPYRIRMTPLNVSKGFAQVNQLTLYSLEHIRRDQQKLMRSVLMVGFTGVLLSLFFCLVIANGLATPLVRLVKGTRRVVAGDYAVEIPVTSQDEIGELSQAFNDMVSGLALRDKYHNILQAVTDTDVAEQLIQGELKLGGEEKKATVLFCDIRGFTQLTEGMPPAEVIQMLNEHMTALTAAVTANHGIVDKFVGDLIMAVFGVPRSSGSDAANAVSCALEMLRLREELNKTSPHKIQVGIGVATGEVLAGCMGSENRLNYTVLGEYVNLASRLCSKAGLGELLTDANTFAETGGLFKMEKTEELTLKGFSAGVEAYKVLGRNPEGRHA